MEKKCANCKKTAVIVKEGKISFCKDCYTKVQVDRASEEMHIPYYKIK